MDRKKLIEKLTELGVPPGDNAYTIFVRYGYSGDLFPNSIAMWENYQGKWEVFTMDDRLGRQDKGIFRSEEEACQYIYDFFVDLKEFSKEYHVKWFGKSLD